MITTTRSNNILSNTPTAAPIGAAEPSAPRALPTNGTGIGRDEFLKMLVAQLRNQDPLNPMDGKDMAAQLAQFSTVEQLITLNTSMQEQTLSTQNTLDALTLLGQTQDARSDELAQLIEGQMAVNTVGKTGVTIGNNTFVDRDRNGSIVVDTGTRSGAGRLTITNEKGDVVSVADIASVKTGLQSFELADYEFTPPLTAGKHSYKFEVATDGGPFENVKTYTVGRITGMRYDNGNPILIIGDALHVPMSQLTQVRS